MNPTMNPPELLQEMRGAVLWLTINREERRNAISPGVLQALGAALQVPVTALFRSFEEIRDATFVSSPALASARSVPVPICRPAPRSSSTTPSPTPVSPTCSGSRASAPCR